MALLKPPAAKKEKPASKKQNEKPKNKDTKDKPVSASTLKEFVKIFKDFNLDDLETVEITTLQDLQNEFGELVDPRVPEQVHFKLADIILIVLLAVLSNCNEWDEIEQFAYAREDWLTKNLQLDYGVPSLTTIQRMISTIDEQMLFDIGLNYFLKFAQMAAANTKAQIAAHEENNKSRDADCGVPEVNNWLEAVEKGKTDQPIDIIALDGKVTKSSKRKDTDQTPGKKQLNTLSAYSVSLGSCLGQEFIPSKTNEITSMPILLNKIGIEGAIVTCDALNTQTDTVKMIIERGSDYVMPIKGNKKTLYEDFKTIFDEPAIQAIREKQDDKHQYLRVQAREQGTTVIREYFLLSEFTGLYKAEEWAGLKAIGFVRRTVVKIDPKTKEVTTAYEDRYYISSIDTILHFAQAVRGHWNVESFHWHLDYTFKDDYNKTTSDEGAKGLLVIKKLALTILKVVQAVSPPYTSLKSLRFVLSMLFERKIAVLLNLFNADVINKVSGMLS